MATVDPFDTLLNKTCNVLRRAAAVQGTNAGMPTNGLPTTVYSNVACRVCKSGGGREIKYDKKVAISQVEVFMRPLADLREKDWLLIEGKEYNILTIDDPSPGGHHFEIKAELLIG